MEESRIEMFEAELQDLQRSTKALGQMMADLNATIGELRGFMRGALAAGGLMVAFLGAVTIYLAERVDGLRSETRTELVALREEMKSDIGAARVEARSDVAAARAEVRSDLAELRGEMKADLASLRVEMKTEIAGLRAEMRSGFASIGQEIQRLQVH